MSSEDRQKNPYLQYGGQAVIEGVMMRSPRYFAVACRKPNGEIIVQDEPLEKSVIGKFQWLNRPLLRGTLALIDAMALGMKALNFAASVQTRAMEEDKAAGTPNLPVEDAAAAPPPSRINDIVVGGTMVFSVCFGIALFIALPTLLTQFIQGALGYHHAILHRGQQLVLNVIDGAIRIGIFLGYIALISRLENIRRVFQYHGAEHKAINTLESGCDLTPDNCLEASRIHPRCGTSFIIVVLLASIVVHSLLPRPDFYPYRLALHIALIPVVAGVAYEIIRLAGRFRESAITRTLLAPGLWSQRLTTREPDREHIEVAVAALERVLAREQGVGATEPAQPVEAAAAVIA